MDWDASIDRAQLSLKWFAFATRADDARRQRYQRAILRVRSSTVAERAQVAASLTGGEVHIPTEVGFAVDDDGRLGDTVAVVAEVRRLAAELEAPDDQDAPKPYLHDYAVVDLERGTPLAEFACRPSVVGAASRYLGVVPILSGIHIMRSPYVAAPISGSQLFHCDWEDVRQVKVFVHCSDVDLAAGPLTAVAARASAQVKLQLRYRYGGSCFRLRDEQVLPRVDPTDVRAFTGATGAVTLIDTSSCLHYGSRLKLDAPPRLVVQFQYLTPTAFDLVLGARRRPVLVRPTGRPDPVERLLLGRRARIGRPADRGHQVA